MSAEIKALVNKGINNLSPEEFERLNRLVEADLLKDAEKQRSERTFKANESRKLLDEMISKLGTGNSIKIDIMGLQIDFVRTMNRGQRRTLLEISEMGKDNMSAEAFHDAEEKFYAFLASVCLDEDLRTPEAWREVDEKTGRIIEVFTVVSDRLTEELTKLEKFRGRVGNPPGGNDKDVRRTGESPGT